VIRSKRHLLLDGVKPVDCHDFLKQCSDFSTQKFTIDRFPVEEEAPEQTKSKGRNNVVHAVGQEIVGKPEKEENVPSGQESRE
jgi:hypothetical protein